jgi:hypothetical protein
VDEFTNQKTLQDYIAMTSRKLREALHNTNGDGITADPLSGSFLPNSINDLIGVCRLIANHLHLAFFESSPK